MTLLFDEIVARCGVGRAELHVWIERQWIRPARENRDWHFSEQDLARTELICDLVRDLDVDPEALDIILPLLDQVYTLRRSLRAITQAVGELPADTRRQVRDRLLDQAGQDGQAGHDGAGRNGS